MHLYPTGHSPDHDWISYWCLGGSGGLNIGTILGVSLYIYIYMCVCICICICIRIYGDSIGIIVGFSSPTVPQAALSFFRFGVDVRDLHRIQGSAVLPREG